MKKSSLVILLVVSIVSLDFYPSVADLASKFSGESSGQQKKKKKGKAQRKRLKDAEFFALKEAFAQTEEYRQIVANVKKYYSAGDAAGIQGFINAQEAELAKVIKVFIRAKKVDLAKQFDVFKQSNTIALGVGAVPRIVREIFEEVGEEEGEKNQEVQAAVENVYQKQDVDAALKKVAVPLTRLKKTGHPVTAVFGAVESHQLSEAGTFDEFLAWLKVQTGDHQNIVYRVKFFGGDPVMYLGSEKYNGTVVEDNALFQKLIRMGYVFYVERFVNFELRGLLSLADCAQRFIVKFGLRNITRKINGLDGTEGFADLHGKEYDIFVNIGGQPEQIYYAVRDRNVAKMDAIMSEILNGAPVFLRLEDDQGVAVAAAPVVVAPVGREITVRSRHLLQKTYQNVVSLDDLTARVFADLETYFAYQGATSCRFRTGDHNLFIQNQADFDRYKGSDVELTIDGGTLLKDQRRIEVRYKANPSQRKFDSLGVLVTNSFDEFAMGMQRLFPAFDFSTFGVRYFDEEDGGYKFIYDKPSYTRFVAINSRMDKVYRVALEPKVASTPAPAPAPVPAAKKTVSVPIKAFNGKSKIYNVANFQDLVDAVSQDLTYFGVPVGFRIIHVGTVITNEAEFQVALGRAESLFHVVPPLAAPAPVVVTKPAVSMPVASSASLDRLLELLRDIAA